MNHKLRIFCDFDGTITRNDVWLEIGEYFISDKEKWSAVIAEFKSQQIGARECFMRECALMHGYNQAKFDEIIDSVPIDTGFVKFVEYCRTNEFPFTILSEGMDYYIARILKLHKLDIPYYANRLVLSGEAPDVNVGLEFPYSDSDCQKCGCCKRNLMLNMADDDEISVFIGDGFSDTCVSHYADIVFAKKSLASYCWKNNITYFEQLV